MQRIFTHVLGNSVVRYQDGVHLAKVQDVLINPNSGKIEALFVRTEGILSTRKVLLPQDIVEWKLNVYVHDDKAFADPNEVVRVEKLIKKNIPIFGNRVETKDGEYLGKVADFGFDTKVMQLLNLYVVKSFMYFFSIERRVIPYKEIVEITKDKIIVKKSKKAVKWRRKKVFSLEDLLVTIDPAMNQTTKRYSKEAVRIQG